MFFFSLNSFHSDFLTSSAYLLTRFVNSIFFSLPLPLFSPFFPSSKKYIVSSSILSLVCSLTHLCSLPIAIFFIIYTLPHSFFSFILFHIFLLFSPCSFSSFSSLKPLRQRGKSRERTVVIRLRVLERKHGGVLFVPAVSRIFHFRCYFIIISYFF